MGSCPRCDAPLVFLEGDPRVGLPGDVWYCENVACCWTDKTSEDERLAAVEEEASLRILDTQLYGGI